MVEHTFLQYDNKNTALIILNNVDTFDTAKIKTIS